MDNLPSRWGYGLVADATLVAFRAGSVGVGLSLLGRRPFRCQHE